MSGACRSFPARSLYRHEPAVRTHCLLEYLQGVFDVALETEELIE